MKRPLCFIFAAATLLAFVSLFSDMLPGQGVSTHPTPQNSTSDVVVKSLTTSGGGNGRLKLPSSGGNTVYYQATSSQQGGTVNPPPFLNAGAVTQPYVICPPVVATDTISSSTTPTETAFATTCTIPAGFLVAGRSLEVVYGFSMVTGSSAPSTEDFKIRLGTAAGTGGTVVFDSGAVSTTSVTNSSRSLRFTCEISGTGPANNSVAVFTLCQAGAASPTNPWIDANTVAYTQNLATNGALVINPTMTFGSAGTSSSNTLIYQRATADN